jgi:hypothetical protein
VHYYDWSPCKESQEQAVLATIYIQNATLRRGRTKLPYGDAIEEIEIVVDAAFAITTKLQNICFCCSS